MICCPSRGNIQKTEDNPQPIIFERLKLPQKIMYLGKRIYRRVRIIKNIGKIFWFRDFMSNFREIGEI